MSVTINELTTEVIAEGEHQTAGGSTASGGNQAPDLAMIRSEMAAIARDRLRTLAEGFDD